MRSCKVAGASAPYGAGGVGGERGVESGAFGTRRSERSGAAARTKGPAAGTRGGKLRKANRHAAPRALALLLAAALAASGAPASALAGPNAGDNELAGEVGITLNVPAHSEVTSRQDGTDIGVRLSIPTAHDDEAKERTVEGTIGIRVHVPTAKDSESERRTVEGTVGIRLAIPTPRTDEAEERTIEEAVGIRLAIPTARADEKEERTVEGTVGIRMHVPTARADEPQERTVEGTIGIRLNIPVEHTVTFDAGGGSFDTGLPTWQLEVARGQSVNAALVAQGIGMKTPAWDGRVFLGWFADAAHTQPYSLEAKVGASHTVYAAWSEVTDVYYDPGVGAFDRSVAWDPVLDRLVDAGDGSGRLVWREAASGVDTHALPPVAWSGAGDVRLVGWWTKNAAGEWDAPVRDGDVVAPSLGGDAVVVYARWARADVQVKFVDEGAGVLGEPFAGMRTDVTLRAGEAPANAAISAFDADAAAGAGAFEVPRRTGYTLDGFWWTPGLTGSADDAGGSEASAGVGSAEAEAVKYYELAYVPGSDGRGNWTLAPALADGWKALEHAVDLLDERGGSAVAGRDGVADTVVLAAKWTAVMRASVPASLTFALAAFGDETPHAVGPGADAFAIRNYTPVGVTLTDVSAKGIEGVDGESGIKGVLYNRGSGEARELKWEQLAGNIVLTAQPQAPAASKLALRIAGAHGATSGSASPNLPVAAWDESTAQPGMLPIEFGLELPGGLHAYESGATGEIARVTFTLAARL